MNDQVNADENVGTMNADRETDWRASRTLDAEVAERVMGWTRHLDAMHPTDNRTVDGVLYCPPGSPGVSLGGFNCVPCYSTKIEAAMKVVEKLKRRMEVDYFPDTGLEWCVMFPNAQGEAAWAKTLPEAICKAALAAIGGE